MYKLKKNEVVIFLYFFALYMWSRVRTLFETKNRNGSIYKKKVKETNNIVGGEFLNCFIPKIT
jgi:hypothetical protein